MILDILTETSSTTMTTESALLYALVAEMPDFSKELGQSQNDNGI